MAAGCFDQLSVLMTERKEVTIIEVACSSSTVEREKEEEFEEEHLGMRSEPGLSTSTQI